jgi:hypothetical protein
LQEGEEDRGPIEKFEIGARGVGFGGGRHEGKE